MVERNGLEGVADKLAGVLMAKKRLKAEVAQLILDELLMERRTQEAIARQQVAQAAPDLAGLQKHIGELMSKVTRMGDDAAKLQGIVVRQREGNREDRYDLYRLIKALKKMGTPEAEEALSKIRPSVIKQMRTFKEKA